MAGQLRDRYIPSYNEFNLIDDADGSAEYVFPSAMTLKKRRRVKVPNNLLVWLASVEIFALDVTADSGEVPRVQLYKNGSLVTGATFDLDVPNSFYALERTTDPFSTPELAFAHNDVIEYWIGSDGGTQTPTGRGIVVCENWKTILIP